MSVIESKYKQKTKIREIIFEAYIEGNLDMQDVMSRLEISRSQFFRLKKLYSIKKSLSHGLCGLKSNRSINSKLKNMIIMRYKDQYLNFNYEHASELLNERDGLNVKPSTLRNWLLSENITKAKQRKPKKYMHREPKERFNEMLQLDGSFGYFLGGDKIYCLMHLVDDATKTSLACLYDAECTNSALDILYKWCVKYGIPKSIYSDRHSTYKVNDRQKLTIEEELEGKKVRLTEFGVICERLAIKQIFAYSPQAKGRVEKKHQLYKDRCIKELKLYGINTLEQANNFLLQENGFIDRLNNKFTVKPKVASTKTASNMLVLAEQFTIQNIRTVRNDYTVQLNSIVYQLPKNSTVRPRSQIIIKKHLDQTISICLDDLSLEYKVIENYIRTENSNKQNKEKVLVKTTKTPVRNNHFRQYKPERTKKQTSNSKQLEKFGAFYAWGD